MNHVRRISLIVVQIKTPTMKKVLHEIYWNLTGDAAGETYAFVYAKQPYEVMMSYVPFSKCQSKSHFVEMAFLNLNRTFYSSVPVGRFVS